MNTTKPIHYPKRSRAFIKEQAYHMLESYYGKPLQQIELPIPVDVIPESLGYTMNYGLEEHLNDAVLGMIDIENNAIWLHSELGLKSNRGRENFTLAHELGHHALHREVLEQESNIQSLFPKETNRILCRETNKKEIQEQQADTFASYLLMPSPLVKREFEIFCRQRRIIPTDSSKQYQVTQAMMTIFETSFQAMEIRLNRMGLFKGHQLNRLNFA